jgi:phosphopantothenoylcysteine decarboxylase/phosphopantothenate--cysteine ligase
MAKENLAKLEKTGVEILAKEEDTAYKVPTPEEIALKVERMLEKQTLKEKKVLIATGKTEEDIDDVRVLSNKASGKFGIEIAKEAYRLGANVALVHAGKLGLKEIKERKTRTTTEMEKALFQEIEKGVDFLFMPAAITDFHVKKQRGKMASEKKHMLELVPREKTLHKIRKKYPNLSIVGFKLEAGCNEKILVKKAKQKMKKEKLLGIVACTEKLLGNKKGKAIFLFGKRKKKLAGTKEEMAEQLWKTLLKL